ncbi:PEP/pyruvate-binding domain-containing protein [Saccharopolyspora rosea]|uniref:PEP/pyruvate-binding domain-containing protein n=1 Tax=Saccharopolyspora rosea TaxID=524884 RepID=A0ABW3FUE3_9PSEU|nr:PEP/pyruvate-binding domain-containing protein [Saccharopolyspora rosea]
MSAVLDLSAVGADMGELVGGKAANLGELVRAGMPVPPGFCVTTDAYDEVCRARTADLVDLLPGDPGRAAEIRARIAAAEPPPELASAITAAYAALGENAPVAVRSSATAEDLPHASFAGQQDTYLNVVGADAVLDAVRHCWSSLWTDRAVAYRAAVGIDHRAVRLAVVVQRMVDAAASGVLFTANPVTGRRTETVVDANRGLGESVVSGSVDPDHFVVESGRITARRLGDKATAVRPRPGGGTETVPQRGDLASIRDEQVLALAELGDRVARRFGHPQDVEWALDTGGTAWLTQSRPITTLFPLPEEPRPGLHVYLSINVAQGVYRPLTPMGIAVLGSMFGGLTRGLGLPVRDRPQLFRDVDGWSFVDITDIARSSLGRRAARGLFAMAEARTGEVFATLLDDPRLSVRRSPAARRVLRVLARTRAPLVAARTLADPDGARARVVRVVEELRAELARPAGRSAAERVAAARRAILAVGPRLAQVAPRMVPVLLLSRLLPRIAGATEEEVQVVLRGVPHNVTTEMDLELWELARRIRRDPESARACAELSPAELADRHRTGTLPGVLRGGLSDFLARYGHRAVAEIDVGVPRWSEAPEYVLGVLAGYVRSDEQDAAERFRRGASEAEAMVDRITSRLRNPLRARLARFAAHRVRELVGLREMPKYCFVLALAKAREHLLAAGRELAGAGRLDRAEDVFFLDHAELAEVVAGTDHRELVARRRETRERELRRRHLPRLLLSDGTEPEAMMPAEEVDGLLTGTSASAGSVTGTARVVLDPAGAELAPGEVLIAPSTDPGWTPLFLTAGGLVMEMGGPNSHGATVAREYGIPAVVGVRGATSRIPDGATVTVRGSSGTITVH